MTDYWLTVSYWGQRGLAHKQLVTPFRTRDAAEAYIERWLSHRGDIVDTEIHAAETGFYRPRSAIGSDDREGMSDDYIASAAHL